MELDNRKILESDITGEQAADLLAVTNLVGEVVAIANGHLENIGASFRVVELKFQRLDDGSAGLEYRKEKNWVCHCSKGENGNHEEVCIYVGSE